MNKLSRDLFFSTAFSVLNVLFNMWLIKEAEFMLSAVALGVFLLMRRVSATFTNLSQLGTSQAIIRFVSVNKNNLEKKKVYFLISFLGWFVSVLILIGLYYFLGEYLGNITYNENENSKMYMQLTLWYIAVLHLSYLVQPYFLTQRKIITYNLISTLNASVILLFVFYYFSKKPNLESILYSALFVMSVLQIVLMLYIIVKLKLYKIPSIKELKQEWKPFYTYSIPRALITFSDMFLLTIGSLLISKENTVIASFLIALVLARMVLVVLQPVSKLSSVIIGNDNVIKKQQQAINLMTGAIVYLTLLFVVLLSTWLDVLLRYWLTNPETITDVLYAFGFIAFGLIPYAFFQGLKGIIEIKYFKPYNLYSLVLAIALHVILFLVLRRYYDTLLSLSISLAIAFVSLGITTVIWCRKDFFGNQYFRFEILILLGVFLFIANYIANQYFNNLIGFVLCSLLSAILYAAVLFKAKPLFIKEAINVLLKRKIT
ncbi:oligosaccharide flippase family protein [Lacinutrix sp. Hel_I_90]|uniref:oligosaccharide flippase family protein n=1 Tax=Lacinutrix sp. Hel_I_90 TaxID=1249999 RepID=UPI0005CA9D65|nr:oligosaccharide flippase family protein [Lacinutrix sp. Hel_I_90]